MGRLATDLSISNPASHLSMNMELARRRDYGAVLLLLAMVLWFSHGLLSGKIPFFRDLATYFYPMRFNLAASFQAGEIPLWNRHVAMGYPLMANFQSGAFYLPHLLFLLIPFFDAIRFLFLFHYLIAAMGSYFLCRQWNYPPYLAMIGSILFTFGGLIVSLTNLLDHFQSAVWLPWALYFWTRFARSRSWSQFLLMVFALWNQLLAGSPEIWAMSLGLLFLNGLGGKAGASSIAQAKNFFLFIAAIVSVIGLAMVQLLPTAELFFESRRQAALPYQEAASLSFHPLGLINLFFLDKEVDTNVINGVHLFFLRDLPFFLSYYVGAISLFGICLWLYYGSLKERAILLGLIFISLALALGKYSPLYRFLFESLPYFSVFRFPEKFFFLTYALLLFVALRGLYHFVERDDSPSRGPLVILFSISALWLVLYAVCRLETGYLARFLAWSKEIGWSSADAIATASGVLLHLERQLALVLGILFLLFLWKTGRLRPILFQPLLVALVFIDLTSAHRPYQYLLDPEVYKGPRVIAAPDSEPYRLFYYPGESHVHPSYYRISRQLSFDEFISLAFSNLYPNTGVFNGFDYMQELDALARRPYVAFLGYANKLPPERLYRLLGALNVKYVSSFQPLPGQGIVAVRYFPEYPSWVYRLEHAVPRAYIVPEAIVEKGPVRVLERLSGAEFDPLREVILEHSLSMSPSEGFQGQAKIVRYTNRGVVIQAYLNSTGVLVLADSFYPGWRVYVDGKEKEVLRANFFFRGVLLTAGKHIVEFRYEPRSFVYGLWISVLTLSGLGIGSVLFPFLRRSKAKGSQSQT